MLQSYDHNWVISYTTKSLYSKERVFKYLWNTHIACSFYLNFQMSLRLLNASSGSAQSIISQKILKKRFTNPQKIARGNAKQIENHRRHAFNKYKQ